MVRGARVCSISFSALICSDIGWAGGGRASKERCGDARLLQPFDTCASCTPRCTSTPPPPPSSSAAAAPPPSYHETVVVASASSSSASSHAGPSSSHADADDADHAIHAASTWDEGLLLGLPLNLESGTAAAVQRGAFLPLLSVEDHRLVAAPPPVVAHVVVVPPVGLASVVGRAARWGGRPCAWLCVLWVRCACLGAAVAGVLAAALVAFVSLPWLTQSPALLLLAALAHLAVTLGLAAVVLPSAFYRV